MSVNKVIIVGHLGRDPETSSAQSGMTIGRMSVATSRRRKVGDNYEDETEWHRIKMFGKTAENCARFLNKGSQVYIEGRLHTDVVEKDGVKRYFTEVIADSVHFLSSNGNKGHDSKPDNGAGRNGGTSNSGHGGGWGNSGGGGSDWDDGGPTEDDIPF